MALYTKNDQEIEGTVFHVYISYTTQIPTPLW